MRSPLPRTLSLALPPPRVPIFSSNEPLTALYFAASVLVLKRSERSRRQTGTLELIFINSGPAGHNPLCPKGFPMADPDTQPSSAPFVVVLEGLDGSGKSSQARILASALEDQGWRVEQPTRDPKRPLRRTYKELIANAEGFPSPRTSLLLGLSDYSYAIEQHAGSAVDLLLYERYCYSTLADGMALGIDPALAMPMAALFPRPDLTIFIDVDPRVALERKGECTLAEAGGPDFRRQHATLEAAFVAYQSAVRAAYQQLEDQKGITDLNVVDGNRSFAEVTRSIWHITSQYLMQDRAA
ncbi:dTMP kinase [Streptomyces lydicus]|uniref:dTMP kinase n=1 Tax=Streptomyces lydicus TaxID=47763 RepID=UPI0036FDCCDF